LLSDDLIFLELAFVVKPSFPDKKVSFIQM